MLKSGHHLKGILDVGAHIAMKYLPGYKKLCHLLQHNYMYVDHLKRGVTLCGSPIDLNR